MPEGAEAIGLVTRDKKPTGVLLRLIDVSYVQGNAGEVHPLRQRAVEKALAAAEAGVATKRKPASQRKPLRP